MKKDKKVRSWKKIYMKEIAMIAQAQLERPAETIGGFRVSPRGGGKIQRVAWHLKVVGDTMMIFIDDFLYHITKSDYVDDWATKARYNHITQANYGGFSGWSPS